MSIVQTSQIASASVDDTLRIAGLIGANLKGGEVVELVSDIGGGKTTFVKGLAAGMGSSDNAHSPSFTLSNMYKSQRLALHHFDFYRLAEPGIMRDELAEIVEDHTAVVAVEWADIVDDVLPVEHIRVTILPSGEHERTINIEYPEMYNYLLANT